MKLVLLSGGSGKRLWPLSNDSRSKQFLKVLSNDENKLESMVQRVWGQLNRLGIDQNAVIATSRTQIDMIKSQIGERVKIIVEPERRDTFPAIALAASYLYSVEGVNRDEIVAVLPVDPYVDDAYFKRVMDLEKVLQESDADLALMGINPIYPSSKYGYIVPESEDNGVITVSHFKEKPSEEDAKDLINKGAIWNSGVFAFRLDSILKIIEERGLPLVYEELSASYNELPKISFDYEVVEKTDNIKAIGYEGYWKDLGTWNTLTEEMGTNSIGAVHKWGSCENTHIINELQVPLTVMDIPNVIIAASPDGILISSKEDSPKIKEVVDNFKQPPMFAERRWGSYRILDQIKYEEGTKVTTKRVNVLAGKNISYHHHNYCEEVWTIVKGEALFVLDGNIQIVRAGDTIEIPSGINHSLKAISDTEFIEIQKRYSATKSDAIRKYLEWSNVEKECYENSERLVEK